MKKRRRLALERKAKAKKDRIQNEILRVKTNGIEFPEYNPPPERRENLTGKLKHRAHILDQKEKARNRTKESRNTRFVGWEYKDRFSHRKSN